MSEVYDGFDGLIKLLNDYAEKADTSRVEKALESGAKEFVEDLLKLPKPRSKINKPGYTHLVDCFGYQKKNDGYVVGWGKYYGRMVEVGTRRTKAQPHLIPTFSKNKEKYYKTMIKVIGF